MCYQLLEGHLRSTIFICGRMQPNGLDSSFLLSPIQADFDLWREAIQGLHPIQGLGIRIGPYQTEGHCIWNWEHDKATDRLL